MKTGAGLAVIGTGAILAFAVSATPSWLNLHIAGWVLMIIGIAGLLIPKRGYGWVGRRIFVRRYEQRPGRPAERVSYPPQVIMKGENTRASLPAAGTYPVREHVPGETEITEDIYEE
jgi:hypothetical protein